MQRVELTSYEQFHCPFCGNRVLWPEGFSPCEHVLFVAVDDGLEYCSDILDKKTIEQNAQESTWDKATDNIEYPGSIKFAFYTPPPDSYGAYWGFTENKLPVP